MINVGKPEELEKLNEVYKKIEKLKKEASEFYKKLSNSKDSKELIESYKNLIEMLGEIKKESKDLDNLEVPQKCFESDDIVQNTLIENCSTIMSLAQHIRGCKESFEKYNQKIESNNKEN